MRNGNKRGEKEEIQGMGTSRYGLGKSNKAAGTVSHKRLLLKIAQVMLHFSINRVIISYFLSCGPQQPRTSLSYKLWVMLVPYPASALAASDLPFP